MRYWKVFGELLWSAIKALLIVFVLSIFQIGYYFWSGGLTGNMNDSLLGSVMLHLFGLILSLPIVLIFTLVAGTPMAMWLVGRGVYQTDKMVLLGASITLVFFKVLPDLLWLKPEVTFNFSSFFLYALGGGLTGFFFSKRVSRVNDTVSRD